MLCHLQPLSTSSENVLPENTVKTKMNFQMCAFLSWTAKYSYLCQELVEGWNLSALWSVFETHSLVKASSLKRHLALKIKRKNNKNAVTYVMWGNCWHLALFMLKPLLANEHVSKRVTASPPPPHPHPTLIIFNSALTFLLLSASTTLEPEGGEWGDKKNESAFGLILW